MPKRRTSEKTYANRDSKVQIDGLHDPFEERKNEAGNHRIMFNEQEREIIRKRQLAQKVLALMVEQSLSIPEIAQQVDVAPREIASLVILDSQEESVQKLKSAVIQKALGMYLDVTSPAPPSLKTIAEKLGMTLPQLKRLTEGEEFQQAYNAFFFQTISDPRMRVVQEQMAEMAPSVYNTLKFLLEDKSTPATVRFGVAKFLAEKMNLVKGETRDTNRNELAKFLSEHGTVNIIQHQTVTIPAEYSAALKDYLPVQEGLEAQAAAGERVDLIPGE